MSPGLTSVRVHPWTPELELPIARASGSSCISLKAGWWDKVYLTQEMREDAFELAIFLAAVFFSF